MPKEALRMSRAVPCVPVVGHAGDLCHVLHDILVPYSAYTSSSCIHVYQSQPFTRSRYSGGGGVHGMRGARGAVGGSRQNFFTGL